LLKQELIITKQALQVFNIVFDTLQQYFSVLFQLYIKNINAIFHNSAFTCKLFCSFSRSYINIVIQTPIMKNVAKPTITALFFVVR